MALTITSRNLWETLESRGRFTDQWHRFLRAVPPAFLQQWNFANVPPQDLALAQAIRDIFSLVPRDLAGCIDGLTSEKVWGWAADEGRKIRITLNDVLVMNDVVCNLPREDVAAQGLAEPDCGFAIPVGQISLEYPFAVVCIYDAITNSLLAARFFNIASLIPEKELEEACKELIAKKDWQKAAALSLAGMREYSKSQKFAELVYQCAEALSDSELADEALGEIMIRGQKYGNPWYVRPGPEQRQQLLEELAAFYNARKWPLEAVEQARVKDIFQELLKEKADPVLEIVYNNFLHNIMQGSSPALTRNFVTKKILAIFSYPATMVYNLPWVRQIPSCILDIYVDNFINDPAPVIDAFDLKKQLVNEEMLNPDKYCAMVLDPSFQSINPRVCARLANVDKIFIGHSTTITPTMNPGGLFISQCSVSSNLSWLYPLHLMDEASRKEVASLPSRHRTEIAYTGPFHLHQFSSREKIAKDRLREQLANQLSINIPANKPLVFCIQGTFDRIEDIVIGLNHLSDSCTIILKTFFYNSNPVLTRLKEGIHIYPSVYQAPNLPKMAADFLLVPFYSGSFATGLMQGLTVLPFYTPILRLRDQGNQEVPYTQFMNKFIQNPNNNPLFYKFFTKWPHFFNILDTAQLQHAIFGIKYIDWYEQNLDKLRKAILGHYHLENAAPLTAQYILKFASEGTLGDECDAVGIC